MDLEFGWGKMKDLGSVWFTMKGSESSMSGTSSDWMSEPSVRVSWPESLEDPVSPASLVSDMQAMFDKIVKCTVGKIYYFVLSNKEESKHRPARRACLPGVEDLVQGPAGVSVGLGPGDVVALRYPRQPLPPHTPGQQLRRPLGPHSADTRPLQQYTLYCTDNTLHAQLGHLLLRVLEDWAG